MGLMKLFLRAALVGVVMLLAACDKVPLLAPANSTITLAANATTVPANGSVGLTAFVSESGGTPVQNGTTVRFTTTLGAVTPTEVQTTNGVAAATFQAGTSSGVAEVHAISGGAAGTSGSGTTTTTTNVVRITVGSAAATKISVRANPATVPASGGTVEISASVTGGASSTDNNPVPGVPVSFSTTAGTLSSTTAITDQNGIAQVTLSTNRKATVSASAGAATPATVDVNANPAASVTLAATPASPVVGQPVLLTVTPATDTSPDVVVDWGDGSTSSLGTVRSAQTVGHAYRNPGNFGITAVANQDGITYQTATAVTVAPPPSVALSVTPSSGTTATTFVFTVTPATANGVKDVTIDFGDGGSIDLGAINSASTVSHRYGSVGSYSVKTAETDGSGNTTSAVTVVTVTP
jgi:hypothetical protein